MSEHKGVFSCKNGLDTLFFLKRKQKTNRIIIRLFSRWSSFVVATSILFFLNTRVWDASKLLQFFFRNYTLHFVKQLTEECMAPLRSFELGRVQISLLTLKSIPTQICEPEITSTVSADFLKTGRVGLE